MPDVACTLWQIHNLDAPGGLQPSRSPQTPRRNKHEDALITCSNALAKGGKTWISSGAHSPLKSPHPPSRISSNGGLGEWAKLVFLRSRNIRRVPSNHRGTGVRMSYRESDQWKSIEGEKENLNLAWYYVIRNAACISPRPKAYIEVQVSKVCMEPPVYAQHQYIHLNRRAQSWSNPNPMWLLPLTLTLAL